MIKSTRAIAVTSAILFSMGAFAQSAPSPNPSATTPDGKNMTPDATATPTGAPSPSMSSDHTSKQHNKKMNKSSSAGSTDASGAGSPSMQVTKDGKTPTPDATIPATKQK